MFKKSVHVLYLVVEEATAAGRARGLVTGAPCERRGAGLTTFARRSYDAGAGMGAEEDRALCPVRAQRGSRGAFEAACDAGDANCDGGGGVQSESGEILVYVPLEPKPDDGDEAEEEEEAQSANATDAAAGVARARLEQPEATHAGERSAVLAASAPGTTVAGRREDIVVIELINFLPVLTTNNYTGISSLIIILWYTYNISK